MLFNSYEFIFIFLPVSFLIYFYLNYKRFIILSKGWLILSSLFFYSWWNIIYLPLILMSMLFNYYIGSKLSKDNNKFILSFGIIMNLLLLFYFKYFDFFLVNINILFHLNYELIYLALPLAISFFTFQQIAYLIDSYKQETKEYDFLNYSLFVTFFPQLIAGPIVHHKEMMPQFSKLNNKFINYKNISVGIFIFSIGLFKKIIIADTFAIYANYGFNTSQPLDILESWITSLSYTFQLYFDFSGYTDMAIGLALLFNIILPINFNSPYKALNIQDFWRRWHITLSRFLKDYLYIPLGGNRHGDIRTYSNLLITFILAGVWHGAGWTFIFWGFLHGIALIIHRVWSKVLRFSISKVFAWFITFNFINIAWVFFRANEWNDAIRILSGMIGLNGIHLPSFFTSKLAFLEPYYNIEFSNFLSNIHGDLTILVFLPIAFIIIIFFNNSISYLNKNYTTIHAFFISFILIISIYSLGNKSEFLYFNF